MHIRSRMRGRCTPWILFALLGWAAASRADPVRVPIVIDPRLLAHLVEVRVFDQPGGVARMWDDGSGCNLLLLRHPQVSMHGEVLRVTADVEAHVGTPVGDSCLFAFEWHGMLEALEKPSLDRERTRVDFHVVDSSLLEPDGSQTLVDSVLWSWVKATVPSRLETVTVDLSETLATLRDALPLFLSGAPPQLVDGIVTSLGLEEVRPTDEGLALWLRFSLPAPPAPPAPSAPVPALSPEELARFEDAAERFDAFLTFVLRQAGSESGEADVRRELLRVLLDGREELVDVLASPPAGAGDPVRVVFLDTWESLAPALRRLGDEVPAEAGLRYLSLVTAADALRALDALGPFGGFEISADGLRRLARVVAPASAEDPLAYGSEVDPGLRSALGFGPPLPEPPDDPEQPPDPRSELWPHFSRLLAAVSWNPLAIGEARAAEAKSLGDALAGISLDQLRRLDRWAPRASELDVYLPLMRDLLRGVASERLAADSLDAQYKPIFSPLVLATAWQETCWRQFVRVAGNVRAIRSRAGAVGLMQINTRVWRGFYSVPSLERHVSYNARAGSEILMRYLRDDVVGDHARSAASPDDLAVAAYAVYNGGPADLERRARHRRARAVDRAFLEKFRAVEGGQDLAVAACFGPA